MMSKSGGMEMLMKRGEADKSPAFPPIYHADSGIQRHLNISVP
jgi:hypothetical protein